jgi:head-tail adaptor
MKLKVDFDEDFDVLDDIDCVFLTAPGTSTSVKLEALRRRVRTGEAATSGGVYTIRDTVFTFPRCKVGSPPGLGGLITPENKQEVFYIYDIELVVNKTRHRCYCRRGFLQSELTDSVTISKNVGGKDSHGAPYKRWLPILSNHPAKVQEVQNSVSADNDRNIVYREAQIYTEATKEIEAGMQVVARNGRTWNVATVTGKGELGLLVVLDVVEARAPGV